MDDLTFSARRASTAATTRTAEPADLDLLAADALITLALQFQAEAAPERLEEFAISVLQTARPGV